MALRADNHLRFFVLLEKLRLNRHRLEAENAGFRLLDLRGQLFFILRLLWDKTEKPVIDLRPRFQFFRIHKDSYARASPFVV